MTTVSYCLDSEDCIVSVGGEWDLFASTNDGDTCLARDVVGRSIWCFVRDPALAAVYERVFTAVRRRQEPLSFPYRCDSPELRRYLRMAVFPENSTGLRIESAVERTEPIDVPLAVKFAKRGATLLHRCSICLDLGLGGAEWLPLEEALEDGRLAAESRPLQAIYSVCPCCQEGITARADGL